MTTRSRLALACMIAMLASATANAGPIAAGTADFDRGSKTRIFEVDSTGYGNMTLTLSGMVGSTVDACGDFLIADGLSASIDGQMKILSVSGLCISGDRQTFGWVALPLVRPVFSLVFDARITGSDKDLTVDWAIAGDWLGGDDNKNKGEESRVLDVSEPGVIALLMLGLAAAGYSRRRIA